jgi:predicted small integral membrane protein
MRMLARFGTLPVAVTVLTGITAVYYLFVVWGNLQAYDVNHFFVERTFAMDTLFQDEHLLWRAITSGALVHIGYILIIIWEALITLVLVLALVAWLRALKAGPGAGPGRFELAKRLSTLGWTMVILLFAGGFLTIGGEWFLLWQSVDFGGALQTAVNNFVIAAVGILMARLVKDEETPLPEPAAAGPAAATAESAEPADAAESGESAKSAGPAEPAESA